MFLWGTLFSFDVFVMLPQFVMSLGRTVDNKEDSDPCQDGQKKGRERTTYAPVYRTQ